MADPSQTELVLATAKQKCLAVCGQLDPAVASDRALAAAAHEPHRVELELAYAIFQKATGEGRPSNPAEGRTELEGRLQVDSGLNSPA